MLIVKVAIYQYNYSYAYSLTVTIICQVYNAALLLAYSIK